MSYVKCAKNPFVELIGDEMEEEVPSRSINSGFGIGKLRPNS